MAVVASALALLACVAMSERAAAQEVAGFDPGAPQSDFGGGAFFSQELGSLLRLRYTTKSYGQDQEGNFDIGTMQVVNFDDAIAFFDGQVTLNDYNGPGYNLGMGFRWLDYVPFMWEPERITGVSLWADGMHTEAGTFFPQVGVSYESLGDMWDIRVNGYLPVGPRTQNGKFELTGETGFIGNSLSQLTAAPSDTAFDEAEIEIARRLGSERDAWAFGGGYVLNSGSQDTAGYRLGLRGYAYPDLLLQIAVSDDDIFKTNAAFQIIWFVGRTRTDYQPTCGLPDRFREPVMRNDYVVLDHSTATGGVGLTDPNGDAIRVVHVNSAAPDGGNGTFEKPLNNLDNIESNSQDGDIVYVWSDSTFSGQAAVLQDNQHFFGEGDGVTFGVATSELGNIPLPETSPGAADAARPIILNALGNAVTLADANEVINFTMDGGTNGIKAGTNGAGDPTLSTLSISNMTENGIDLTPFVREDATAGTETVAFNVMIDGVTFDNNAGTDIKLNAHTDAAVGSPSVTLDEAITINNVTSTNNGTLGIDLIETHDGGSVALTDWSYTNGATALEMEDFNSTFSMGTSTLADSSGAGVNVIGDSGGTITFDGSNTWDNLDGIAFCVGGTFTGSITMQDDITNNAGLAARIEGLDNSSTSPTVTLTGTITDTGAGIFVGNNNGGLINFAGDLMLTTTTNNAIQLDTNSDDTEVDFSGNMTISTTIGTGFFATNGGTISATGAQNKITTTTGTGVNIQDSVIGTLGVSMASVDVTAAGATNGVLLEDNTGGTVTIGKAGDAAGEGGTIGNTTDAAVRIVNTNATLNGLQLNNAGNAAGEDAIEVVHSNSTAMAVNVNDTDISTLHDGIGVTGTGASANLNMTVQNTTIGASTGTAMDFQDVGNGTVNANNVDIDNAASGVLIQNSDASFTYNNQSSITNVGGTDFEVNGGDATVSMSGTITNTSGRSIQVQNKTAGNVTFLGAVTDSGTGISVNDNTGGSVNLLGTYNMDTTTNTAVSFTNNGGTSLSATGLDINTTSGNGFVATGGGDLTVTGSTNAITTTTGVGLDIDGMNIVSQANFQSVNVSNGATKGIVLNDVTGSTVTVGNSGGATNSGGTLTTAGDAIQITNVENATLNHVRVANSTGGQGVNIDHTNAATTSMNVTINDLNLENSMDDGINALANDNQTFSLQIIGGEIRENVVVDATGSGQFNLNVDGTTIDLGAGDADIAFDLQFSGDLSSGDVTIQNNDFKANAGSAMFVDSFGTTDNKSLRLLIQDSDFMSTGTDESVVINSRGDTQMDLTVQGNTFNSAGATSDLSIQSNSAGTSARINLQLGGEDTSDFNNPSGVGDMHLEQTAGSIFRVFERDITFANVAPDERNFGTVSHTGTFGNLATTPDKPNFP